MFNLLIAGNADDWRNGVYEFERSRVVVEYTSDEIVRRYENLDVEAINELKSFPAIFATEGEQTESRIGYITEVRVRGSDVRIEFRFAARLPALPVGALRSLRQEFGLGRFELTRTHWAVKNEPLWDILFRRGFISQEELGLVIQRSLIDEVLPEKPRASNEKFNGSQVFVVHGHDELLKLKVADFVRGLGLEPIILHMQASMGQTIIEKIEHYSNVGFGIVLYTPCDEGRKCGTLTSQYRARQNVVFEHGYLIGKLGRSRVSALVSGIIETPNDVSGVVYVPMDEDGEWALSLKAEIQAAGYPV